MKTSKQTLIYLLALFFVMNVQIYSQSRKAIGKIFSSEIESKLSVEQMNYLLKIKFKKGGNNYFFSDNR
ncbi:MAG: hypothetical protein KKD86_17315 [Bacteroidetes bacterium]|nr:hypothetical protein [Bacteroidota bacterium]MBU1680586.1 hypothetical protein [Bacteroidota bacterium]